MFSGKGAGAVIHTHSKHCVMVTLLFPGKEFRITHQEMIKGMKKGTTGINYRLVGCPVYPKDARFNPVYIMYCIYSCFLSIRNSI